MRGANGLKLDADSRGLSALRAENLGFDCCELRLLTGIVFGRGVYIRFQGIDLTRIVIQKRVTVVR
jgi:hypothetical protein